MPSNTPCHTVRIRNLEVAIWHNVDKDGNVYHTFTTQKSYRDNQGNWQTTRILNLENAATVATMLQIAASWSCEELARA